MGPSGWAGTAEATKEGLLCGKEDLGAERGSQGPPPVVNVKTAQKMGKGYMCKKSPHALHGSH